MDTVEARLQELEERVRRLEGARAPAPKPFPVAAPATAPAAPTRTPQPPPLRTPALDLEELLGGRVLAWAGGIAIVLAVAFFLALAIDRGWIDEATRVVLAFTGSTALLGAGLWLYGRRGRTQAALAAVAAAIAALYASDVAATVHYHLVGEAAGLAIAALVGIVATAIAVRWDSPVVGGIGILGALLAPVLVGAGVSALGVAFVAAALAAAVGVLLWRRWSWLGTVAFLVGAPQLGAWVWAVSDTRRALPLLVVTGFGLLYGAAALGFELRVPSAGLRISSALLLFANAATTAALGWIALDRGDSDAAAKAWVLGVAAVHVAFGAAAARTRMSREIPALLAALGAAVGAVGLAVALDGPALVAGWAAEAVLLAFVARRTGDARGYVGAAAFAVLATAHALVFEAPPDALAVGVDSLPVAAAGLALAAGACLALGHALPFEEPRRIALGVAAVVGVYLGSVAIVDLAGASELTGHTQASQLALSAFWTVAGVGALVAGLLRDVRPVRLAGLALLALAVGKVYVVDLAALESVYRVGSFLALGLLLLGAAFAYQRIRAVSAE